ncbi:MAG: hypothetical protein SGJ10_06000 [Bacteroidota bacterium]|nr:hypothetical protein [Bacteroidota bacterium]
MVLNNIYISWRKGKGGNRYLIGLLERLTSGFAFSYIKEEVIKARNDGFKNYPDFSTVNFDHKYTGDLERVFSLRLMPEGRPDREQYLSFWDANNPKYDWFDELGFTQGRLATDNFEFLAKLPYYDNNLGFVTDIASLTHNPLPIDKVKQGDKLRFELDTNHLTDPSAVKVYKDSEFIGYIKRGHSFFFKDANRNRLRLTVKHIEKNGMVNQLYISVIKE